MSVFTDTERLWAYEEWAKRMKETVEALMRCGGRFEWAFIRTVNEELQRYGQRIELSAGRKRMEE